MDMPSLDRCHVMLFASRPVRTPEIKEKVRNTGRRLKNTLWWMNKKNTHTNIAVVWAYAAATLIPTRLKLFRPSRYNKPIMPTDANPPARLRKKVGLRNVPPKTDPSRTRNSVTCNAARNPRNTRAIKVMMLASPSLTQGVGRGSSASRRCNTTPSPTSRAMVAIRLCGF
jgi:hypothetical protein